jgi:hypothetical protein
MVISFYITAYKKVLAIVLFVVTLTAVGCGGPPSSTDQSELKMLVETSPEVATLLATDPLQFVADYTSSGTGGVEQGIMLVLESMLQPGIVPQQLVAAPAEEGTIEYGDFLMVADHYRQYGRDEQARDRISSLLGRVFVDIKVLEQWAKPSAQSTTEESTKTAGNFFVAAARAQTSSASCREVWDGLFPAETTPRYCFDVEAWTYRGSNIRIFYPIDWNDNPADKAWVGRTKTSINQSLDKFVGNLGLRNENIDVQFHTRNVNDRTRADSSAFSSSESCRIRAFPRSFVSDPDSTSRYQNSIESSFKQVVAHETYHCFQAWNFPEQDFGPYLSDTATSTEINAFYRARNWWLEGTAEFFSNYVFPCTQTEFERIAQFDEQSPNTSMIEMAYENVLFFMYMGRSDPASVVDMSRNMATSGEMEEQYAAAAGYGLGRKFQRFGEAYVDENIRDSCPDVKMPVSPYIDEYDVARGSERDEALARFVLGRIDLNFSSGDYNLEYEHGSVDFRISARELEDTLWKPPPGPVNAGCQYRNMRMVMTYSQLDTPTETFFIRETNPPDAAPERTSKIDSCLIGSWRATNASMQAIGDWAAAEPMTRKGMTTEKKVVSGQVSGTFRRNGFVVGHMRDFTQQYLTRLNMGTQNTVLGTTVIMNDSSGARYSADNGVLTIWDACSQPTIRAISELNGEVISDQAVDLEKVSKMDGLSSPAPTKAGGWAMETLAIPSEFEMRYTCNGSELKVEYPFKTMDKAPPWRFTKISSN